MPVDWTDAHHAELPWYYGGQTNIDELLSLCRYHHVLAHEGRWTIRLDHATGEVHVTRPDGTPYELGPSQPFRPMPQNRPHWTGRRPHTDSSNRIDTAHGGDTRDGEADGGDAHGGDARGGDARGGDAHRGLPDAA